MKTRARLVVVTISVWLLAGCQSAGTPVPTVPPASPATAVPPTNTPAPTNTPLPTETPRPTPTPLPEGILFRDDFEGALQPGWQWENENPAKWSFTNDGWLQIVGEYDSLLGGRQNNLLWYPLPKGDFVITAHLITKPFANFHQAAIFIYEDAKNYITINRGYCDLCSTGGNGIYMDYKIGGAWGDYSAATNTEDVYLRLESTGSVISGYYATDPTDWVRLGRFGNYFQFKKVGIGVSNCSASEDVVGKFDYFEISAR